MHEIEKLLNLKEFNVLKIQTYKKNKVILNIETKLEKLKCPRCKCFTSSIDHKYEIEVRDNSVFNKEAYLRIKKKVFICRKCNHRFVEQLNSIDSNHPYTQRFEKEIFENCLENTISNVSRIMKVPYESVQNIYQRIGDMCVEHLMKFKEDIEILGIDEIAIHKGHSNFQAVVSNIGKGYVMDVLPDRKKETVIKYLKKLPQIAKKRIVFVSIDMWEGYFQATKEVLPNTKIVIDRFHVMKNLNQAITRYRRAIQRSMPEEIREKYKGYRWIILKNEENMTEEDIKKLKKMINDCPELKKLYELKIKFQEIFNHSRNKETANKKIKEWEKQVKELNNEEMNSFIKLLNNWREFILNYFVSNGVTNAFVEGMNNKIKLIKRMGYGYRSKLNFRRRVLIECGYDNLREKDKLIFLYKN